MSNPPLSAGGLRPAIHDPNTGPHISAKCAVYPVSNSACVSCVSLRIIRHVLLQLLLLLFLLLLVCSRHRFLYYRYRRICLGWSHVFFGFVWFILQEIRNVKESPTKLRQIVEESLHKHNTFETRSRNVRDDIWIRANSPTADNDVGRYIIFSKTSITTTPRGRHMSSSLPFRH